MSGSQIKGKMASVGAFIQKTGRRPLIKWGVVLLILIIGGFFLFAPKQKGISAKDFETISIARGNIVEEVTASGKIQPINTVSVGIATDAMRSAAHAHQHFGLDAQGRAALVATQGNPDTHLVLRGGHHGPNYDAHSIAQACAALTQAHVDPALMVDCSHANSGKNPQLQPQVLQSVLAQRAAGEHRLRAVMLESNLVDGQQALCDNLQYGVSITDGCLGWDATAQMLLQAVAQLNQ